MLTPLGIIDDSEGPAMQQPPHIRLVLLVGSLPYTTASSTSISSSVIQPSTTDYAEMIDLFNLEVLSSSSGISMII